MAKIFSLSCLCICLLLTATAQQYKVYALKYADLQQPTPVSNWVKNGPEKDRVPIAFMFWLITDGMGKNILLDAGCKIDLPQAIDFGVSHYLRPDSVLMPLNLQAGQITDIIISHPHWDHIDGLDLFPNARVWMQQKDYTYYVSDAWQKDAPPGGIARRDIVQLVNLNLAGRLTLLNGDDIEILPGIRVLTGSRHTYDSQAVLVQSGNDRIVLASDNIWIYYNLEKLLPPPDYGTFDAAGYVMNMKRMKTLVSKPEWVVPGHDNGLFSKFKKISDRIVQIR